MQIACWKNMHIQHIINHIEQCYATMASAPPNASPATALSTLALTVAADTALVRSIFNEVVERGTARLAPTFTEGVEPAK